MGGDREHEEAEGTRVINDQQRAARKNFICSSDAPAICGVDQYRTAADVYLDKIGLDDGFAGNEHTERGNLLEPVLIQWAQQKLGVPLARDIFIAAKDGQPLAANLDAANADQRFIVEAKTSTNPDEWGEEGDDQGVPDRVLIQTAHALHVTGYAAAHVVVLLPIFGRFVFRHYPVPRNEELCRLVAAKGIDFWTKHVQPKVQPTGCVASLDVLKRIRRQPNKTVDVPAEIAERWIVARAARLQAEKDEEQAQRELMAMFGDAEAGAFGDGRVITYFSQASKRLDTKLLEQRYPSAAAECRKETTHRVLRIKSAKGV
jgi:putative phage-type endonuclease